MKKKNHEILAAMQYKPIYDISPSESGVRKIQAAAYNITHMVYLKLSPKYKIVTIKIQSVQKHN